MFHIELMTPEEENQTWSTTQMIIIIIIIITTHMMMTGSLMSLMKGPILLDPRGQVEVLDQHTTLEEKVPEIQAMVQEIKEETPPEITIGTGREGADNHTEVSAEKEGEEMELPELGNLIMGSQGNPEGVARRPNVWWGLL